MASFTWGVRKVRVLWAMGAAMLICPSADAGAQEMAPSNAGELQPPPPDLLAVVAPAEVEPGRCQIHVWATTKIKSYITGFTEAMGGGVLGAALDGQRANGKTVQSMLEGAIQGRRQAELLARVDLAGILGMPNVALVPEPKTTQELGWKTAKGRLSESKAACYGEIIVRDMYFLKSALFPPTLRVNFTFRDFRDGSAVPTLVQGRGGVKLDFYPTVSTNDERAITLGFENAYVGAFEEFVAEQRTKKLK